MISLTAELSTALAQPMTAPSWLVHIHSTPPMRLSSRGTVSFGGSDWVAAGLACSGLTDQSGKLSLVNDAGAFGALLLTLPQDTPVSIWQAYVIDGGEINAVQVFDGVIDGGELDGERVTLDLAPHAAGVATLPRHVVAPPVFRHLPAPGTVIAWGGEKYTLEAR